MRRSGRSWVMTFGLVCAVCPACGADDDSSAPVAETTTSERTTTTVRPAPTPAADYLAEAAEIVRTRAYYADRVDWAGWDAQAVELAADPDADDAAGARGLVDDLVAQLADRHSQLLSPTAAGGTGSGRVEVPAELPDGQTPSGEVSGTIGRIELPTVAYGPDSAPGRDYVSAVRHVLAEDACGWIVDLRTDGGGDVTTMLVALAPLLGPGPSVAYRHRDGTTERFVITDTAGVRAPDGTNFDADEPAAGADETRFLARGTPVAVLQGSGTASSGEGVAVALRNRRATRSFGAATNGVPTGRERFDLADGSALVLTTAIAVDTEGTTYEGPILPDVEVGGRDLLAAAEIWLDDQPPCSP